MMTIELVNGATIQGLDINMRPAMIIAGHVYGEYGKPLTITCGLNGEHSAGSLHYYGRAIDLRTNFWEDDIKQKVYMELRDQLPTGYDVVQHTTHIHLEY